MSLTGFRILAGILIQAVLILNIFTSTSQLLRKATPPFGFYPSNDKILAVLEDSSRVTLSAAGGIKVSELESVEVICDLYEAGDIVKFDFLDRSRTFTREFQLTRFYSTFHVFTQLAIAAIFILVGSFVLYKQPKEVAAFIFYLCCTGVAAILMMTWGTAKTEPVWSGDMNRAIFHLAYGMVPVLFVHFSMVYPVRIDRRMRFLLIPLYMLAVLFFSTNFTAWIYFHSSPNSGIISTYTGFFDHSRLFILLCVVIAIAIFIYSYVKATRVEDKKRLLWLLTGFLVGPLGFVLLWVIPQAFTGEGLVSETFVSSLMLAVPITFTISIVKYHFLDIDLIINRSLVYIGVIIFFGTVYFALLIGLSIIISENLELKTAVVVIVLFSLIFHPLRNRVQTEVDRLFFRVRYNFKESLIAFQRLTLPEFSHVQIGEHLGGTLLRNIPLDLLSIAEYDSGEKCKDLFASPGDGRSLPERLKVDNGVFSKRGTIEARIDHELLPVELEDSLFSVLISLPLVSQKQFIIGFGDKRSGFQFSGNDIEFISALAKSSADAISAIELREDLVRKELEKERLYELNEQKSLFVSSVSHDLKTPLTSINLLAQQMKRKHDLPRQKIDEYLEVIIGESERLKRLIDNVLDFSRMEKGINHRTLQPVDLREVIQKVNELLEYQLKSERFTLVVEISDKSAVVEGNQDALVECLINLVSNSIKFCGKERAAKLSLDVRDSEAVITVSDKGIGMTKEEKDRLFTPYYRSETSINKRIPGTGLGLSIVKNIVDSHGGRIEVESEAGEGTVFRLIFKVIE